MTLQVVPIDFTEACRFVNRYHRHHISPVGHKYSLAVAKDENIIGVAIVGRPIARHLDKSWTLEVTRCCTDGTKNACSFLYAACWRVARNLGYRRLITYILESEPGTSLAAAGWKELYHVKGRSWNCKSRPRIDKHPLQNKILFEIKSI